MIPEALSATSPVSVDGVCFAYPGREVLHGISFSIPDKSLTAVVGPNGGGKTTLLRLMLGELKPECGTIRIFGMNPSKARSRIGYVPQSAEADPKFPMSVMEAVLAGRAGKCGLFHTATDRAAAMEALERTGMAAKAKRPAAELSGGEWQRVMISQALASDPDILLLDEPAANVDFQTAAKLYELFAELSHSIPVVMVSHNLSVVTRQADWVLCVNRTAGMHRLGEVASETFQNSFGATLALIRHDGCPVGGDMHDPVCKHFSRCSCGCGEA